MGLDEGMGRDDGRGRLIAALGAAAVSFCGVGVGLYYVMAQVATAGWRLGGPTALTGEMAGLFGGGLAAVIVLIGVLRWRRGGRG